MKDNPVQVHIYGDSILKGIVMDRESGKYMPMPQDDFAELAERYPLSITNKSKFGFTIDRGCALLGRALRKGKPCDAVVLEYGGNDCNHDWKAVSEAPDAEHLPVTPPQVFCKTLRSMIHALQSIEVQPVLTSLPPIDSELFLDHVVRTVPGADQDAILRWMKGDRERIYRHQERYSAMVTAVAAETGCMYIDLRSAFLAQADIRHLLCADGIHPNADGHRLIAEAFSSAADRFFAQKHMFSVPVGA